MVSVPRGWRCRPRAEGLTLLPGEGEHAEWIRYHERVRPLEPIGRLLRRQLQVWPAFTVERIGEVERLTTREGEHAALVEVSGRRHDAEAARVIGVTFGDDFYALVSGFCADPGRRARHRELVRTLVLEDSLGLGVRRRRYEHDPPAGWLPFPTGAVTEWLPPGFPGDQSVLTVHPASPRATGLTEIFDALLGKLEDTGLLVVDRSAPLPCAGRDGLAGGSCIAILESATAARQARTLVVLQDDRYSYPAELGVHGDDPARHAGALAALAASIRPIPRPAGAASLVPPLLHWTT